MRFTTTGVLLAVLVAVAAYFFLVEEKAQKTKEKEHRKSTKLFPYEPKDIERFVLINPKGERVEVEHLGSDWKVVSPVAAPGDEPTISSFIGQIVPGWIGEEITHVANPADYGLDKPFATLILSHRGGAAPDTLFIGDKTPTSSTCYARIGSSGAVLISKVITHNVMNKGLYHFRDKNFLSFDGDAVDALAIRAGTKRIQLEKKEKLWWFAGRHVRADGSKIEPYLTGLTKAIIRQFVREDLDSLGLYGLKTPASELTLTRGAETTRIAFGGKQGDEVFAVRTGLDKVIRLEGKLLEAFDWNADNLRAMNLTFFQADSVTTVKCETPDTTVVLRRTGKRWSTTGADTLAIRSNEVNAFLQKLGSARFERIVKEPLSSGEPKLAKFILRVTLEDSRGAALDRIVLARPSKGSELGASTSANVLGSLAPRTIDALNDLYKGIGPNR